MVASYLKKKTHKGSSASKLCNYSQYKKLEFISKNQRFGGRCNLQKRLVKHKRRSESEEACEEERREYRFADKHYANAEARVFDQQDMLILADETPDERKFSRVDSRGSD